jgi:hypothetical protein
MRAVGVKDADLRTQIEIAWAWSPTRLRSEEVGRAS